MATATATKEYNIPENYSQILDKVQNMLMSKVDTVKYTPQSASALKSAIAKALRPQYDAAIRNRENTAAANRASIDADAAARGLGSSSWVTDVKNRQNNAAAKDVANLEGQYSAALYQNLMNKLSEQDQLSLSAQQANAGIQQNALSTALGLTDKYYKEWAPDSSGSSGGSGRRSSEDRGPGGNNPIEMTIGELSQLATGAKTAEEARQTYKDAISGYNGKVKVTDYNPSTHDYYIGKTIKDTTSGKDSLVQKVIDTVKAKRKAEKTDTAANRKKTR